MIDVTAGYYRFVKCLHVLRPLDVGMRLLRVGGEVDGAYLIPDDLRDISACFSPGCCNTKRFEDALLHEFQIRSHLCDFTSDVERFDTAFSPGLQTFEKKWLSALPAVDSISLEDWVEKYEGTSLDLLLQMDIEGAEFENLFSVPERILQRFRIIVVEFHVSESSLRDEVRALQISEVIERLGDSFYCVHNHPNNCCGEFEISGAGIRMPRVFECTFLRKDRVRNSASSFPFASLPHPLDITHNVHNNAPLFLGNHWGSDVVSAEAAKKMMEIVLADGRIREKELLDRIYLLEAESHRLRRLLGELNVIVKVVRWLKQLASFFRLRTPLDRREIA